jgi:2-polyprenyl-3-methyl-5-hydroxy-6-metoxy-1,4-benzoquinol methylase
MPNCKPPAIDREAVEGAVRDCYSTWSAHYYDDYYQGAGAYPPVHTDIVRGLLRAAGARSVLDAGCGPASMLRDLAEPGLERWGFDLTPEMVAEARRVLAKQGLPAERVWEGSVLDPAAFQARAGAPPEGFDAVVCFGVLPHVPAEGDAQVLTNLRAAVRPGGLVAIEARNQLFALFTFNRYSRDFFHDVLIGVSALEAKAANAAERAALDRALVVLDQHFRIDLPPERKGGAGRLGYDEVLSRTHNPFLLRQLAQERRLADVEVLFYHYHALPPILEGEAPELFRRASLATENPRDWRGHFMASAFVLVGRRPL